MQQTNTNSTTYRSHNSNEHGTRSNGFKAFKLNYSNPNQHNQRISFKPSYSQIDCSSSGMNMGQDRQMRMVGANGGNQFRQYAGQNVGNQVVQDAVQNQGVQNIGNGNCPAATVLRVCAWDIMFDLMAAAADLDEIEEVNANCILMANLLARVSNRVVDLTTLPSMIQTAKLRELLEHIPEPHQEQTEAAKFVRDFKSLAKEADESLAKHKALELEIERLLRAVVSQDIMSIVQNPSVVDSSNLQTELDRTKERLENSYNDMQQKIERLQAQLGDLKGKSKDTQCVSNTLDPLSQKLENENVELEFQVQNYEMKLLT
ncbi:hypothetical protein Tco_1404790 [Tanacetum coccineum]